MMGIDQNKLQQAARQSFDKVSGNRRWGTPIVKATAQLEANPYMRFDGQSLLILSPSGEIHSANGACQCKAFLKGQPCWHRAAASLIKRYNETSH